MEAVDAALSAAADVAEYTGGPAPFPLDLMGGEMQPACLAPFTKWEIAQACAFLVRIGLIDAPRGRKAA